MPRSQQLGSLTHSLSYVYSSIYMMWIMASIEWRTGQLSFSFMHPKYPTARWKEISFPICCTSLPAPVLTNQVSYFTFSIRRAFGDLVQKSMQLLLLIHVNQMHTDRPQRHVIYRTQVAQLRRTARRGTVGPTPYGTVQGCPTVLAASSSQLAASGLSSGKTRRGSMRSISGGFSISIAVLIAAPSRSCSRRWQSTTESKEGCYLGCERQAKQLIEILHTSTRQITLPFFSRGFTTTLGVPPTIDSQLVQAFWIWIWMYTCKRISNVGCLKICIFWITR